MSDKLQQAIQATRAGDEKNAQFLLTQAIQENPDNPQSWYLLSLLVGDKEKKQTYLTKVLDLDPDHAKAHQQLVAMTKTAVPQPLPAVEFEEVEERTLTKAAPVTLSSDSPDLETQDAGETLPDWMADDLPDMTDDAEEAATATAVASATEEPIPDWLENSVDEDWDKEETAVDETISDGAQEKEDEQAAETAPKEIIIKEKKPAKSKKSGETKLNYILIGLVIVSIIIVLILAYMISTRL